MTAEGPLQLAHIVEVFLGTFIGIIAAYICIKPTLNKDRAAR
jgi:flagellar motor component MotA